MLLQCMRVKISGLEVTVLKDDRRNGCSGEECVHVSDGRCLLSAMEYCKNMHQWYRNLSMDVCSVSQYITLLANRFKILCLKLITQKNTVKKIGRFSGKRIVYVLVVVCDRDGKHLLYH